MEIKNEWISEWGCEALSPFLFFSFKLMAFLSLFREHRHTVAKPECQEDEFLFLGWAGPLEKFHFNWKMDPFTSWLGLMGHWISAKHQWRGGCNGKSVPSNGKCSGTSEDNLVSVPSWVTQLSLPFSFPDALQSKFYLPPNPQNMHVLYCSIWNFCEASLMHAYLFLYIPGTGFHCHHNYLNNSGNGIGLELHLSFLSVDA